MNDQVNMYGVSAYFFFGENVLPHQEQISNLTR